MAEPEIVTATEASRAFSDLLHRVSYGGESFIIKKGNRLMARIVPVEAVEEAPAPIPEAQAEEPADHPCLAGLTQDEADYYKTVVEQLRKTTPELCD